MSDTIALPPIENILLFCDLLRPPPLFVLPMPIPPVMPTAQLLLHSTQRHLALFVYGFLSLPKSPISIILAETSGTHLSRTLLTRLGTIRPITPKTLSLILNATPTLI
jgi:hypothetical protein